MKVAHACSNVSMVFEYKKNEQGHYICGTCGATKEKQNTMHYHMQRHEGTMSYACSSKGCGKKFYQKYALDEHVKLHHSSKPVEPSIKCPWAECKHAFHKKEHCRVHIARNHLKEFLAPWIQKKEGSKVHTCGNCKKEYNSYPAILYHVMEHAKDDITMKDKLASI